MVGSSPVRGASRGPFLAGLAVAVVAGACGGDGDGPLADASVDAFADAPVDADTRCDAGRLCLETLPIGASRPAGRIVVAWQPAAGTTWQIAYDQPWTPGAITEVPFQAIALPDACCQFQGPCGPGVLFASATVILSTDPDDSGSITSDEINSGYASGDVYGIHQQIVTWSDLGCGPTGSLPDGLAPGRHVYRAQPPPVLLDGQVTALATCQPRTAACQQLPNPF